MTQSRRELALGAAAAAMRLRGELNYDPTSPISVYDLSERVGVSVFFQDIPSMEGLYMPEARPRPVILVSSLRPGGRRAMTCGHELGHHVFKHGRQWDELVEDRSESRRFDPDEFQADLFSACLQMPKIAVSHAFACRGLNPEQCRAVDVFTLSTFFGVSYEAFVTHMERTLNLIGTRRASELTSHKPNELRAALLGASAEQNVVVADFHWKGRAIDVEVGDFLIFPSKTALEGGCAELQQTNDSRTLVRALAPGMCRVSHSNGWCAFVRVARKNYVGRAPLRFDEEVCDDE